jgi:hypothetical protein
MTQPQGREEALLATGSPTFSVRNDGVITAGTAWVYELEGTTAHKYLPMDSITIANTSARHIQVDIGAHTLLIPANSIRTKDKIAYTNVKITNLDVANSVSANEIMLTMWREPITQDTDLQRKYGRNLHLGLQSGMLKGIFA